MKQSTVCRYAVMTAIIAITAIIFAARFVAVSSTGSARCTPKQQHPDFADDAAAAMNWAYITGDVSRFILGGEIVYCFGRINGDPVTCYGTNTTRVNE